MPSPERSAKPATVYVVLTQHGTFAPSIYNIYSNREAAEKCAESIKDACDDVDIEEWGVIGPMTSLRETLFRNIDYPGCMNSDCAFRSNTGIVTNSFCDCLFRLNRTQMQILNSNMKNAIYREERENEKIDH